MLYKGKTRPWERGWVPRGGELTALDLACRSGRGGVECVRVNGSAVQVQFDSLGLALSVLEGVSITRASMRCVGDYANWFAGCSFERCNFGDSVLGLEGSRYVNCRFINCSFRGAGFVSAEISGCEFIDCDLTNVEFGASALKDTRFAGTLSGVVFGQGYASRKDLKRFGPAPVNTMEGVDFSEATLDLVAFRRGIDLRGVRLDPGRQYRIDRLEQRLQDLARLAAARNDAIGREAGIYAGISLPDSRTQDQEILDRRGLAIEFGQEAADFIVEILTAEPSAGI